MPKSYYCEYCDYKTTKKSSFTDHLKSRKHVNNSNLHVQEFPKDQISSPERGFPPYSEEIPPYSEETFICSYCEKTVSNSWNLKRHYRFCKNKKIHDIENKFKKELEAKEEVEKQLKEEMELQKEKLEELEEVQSDYYDLLRQIAKSKTSPQTINLHYVVNNFTEALNYEDLMTPKLTDEEADEVRELEPIAGTINLIEKRCIVGMDVKKRPLHCLDTSRNKYLVRTENEWVVDHYAKRIFKGAAKHIHDMYATNPTKSNLSIEQIMRNQQKLLKLESKSSKNKMIKDLNDKVYIKNIKIDSIIKN